MWRSTCLALLLAAASASNEECSAEGAGTGADEGKKDCGCSSLNRAPSERALGQGSLAEGVAQLVELSPAAASHNLEMVEIPPGRFHMGEQKDKVHFPHDGEGPLRPVRMSGFRMDKFEVSNAKFHDFVRETGYITDAERMGDSFVAELYLSDAVSAEIKMKVDAVPWWLPVPQANWIKPEGSDSGLNGSRSRFGERWNHPVVHMSWNDADAYCRWRNGTLPTEAQWEYAARGGLQVMLYPWGDTPYRVEGKRKKHRMNIWQGTFPKENTAKDGYTKTAPVDAFGEQNAWGLHNMVGNVWEWTSDWFTPVHFLTEETRDTGFIDPTGPSVEELDQVAEMGYLSKDRSGSYEKVKKGGSFMCHKSYCWRYRVCARSHLTPDSSAHHTGFRCVRPSADEKAAHWSMAPENDQGS
eukprot:gb/GFBE01065484.1/.p1 GENE.gb/GFBE01065484.1/~~gb/GFBE01065484.1/.p1  ORF type:complete len:412 (+),score=81.74 gb/GFBE01065484.1/:1-1236(+)